MRKSPNTRMKLSPRAAPGRQEVFLRVERGGAAGACHSRCRATLAPPPGAAYSQDVRSLMKTLLIFVALLAPSVVFGGTTSYRHTLFMGASHFQAEGAPTPPHEYQDDVGFVVGYRLLYDYLGFGVEWSRFTLRHGGDYPADDRIDWIELGVRARVGVTVRRLQLSAIPAIGLGFESGRTNFIMAPESQAYGWGSDDSSFSTRQYFVYGLSGEASWPISTRFNILIGGVGRGFEDMTGYSTESSYPPKVSSMVGGYVALEYQH